MITSRVRMIFLENQAWQRAPLAELVRDLVISERRIGKGSSLETERIRYGLTCQFLEETAADLDLKKQSAYSTELETDFLETLLKIKNQAVKNSKLQAIIRSGRLLATVFPPDLLKTNLETWDQLMIEQNDIHSPTIEKRLSSIRKMVEKQAGLVEINVPYQEIIDAKKLSQRETTSTEFDSPPAGLAPAEAYENEADLTSQTDWLKREIDQSLEFNTYVNFSNPNHIVITQVLHEYVYQHRTSPATIRVVYGDGSEAERFRFDGIGEPNQANKKAMLKANQLHVSLVSMRHPDQDLFVNSAWFINQRVSASRAFAETEQLCCEKTIEELEQIKKPILIHIYQTGLQPAVVGFYRGFLNYRKMKGDETGIWIQPYFFRNSGKYQVFRKIWW